MICIIALIVFAVMAIFSARFRPLFKEALDCVGRRVTFRPCVSGLDERLKSQITGKLMKKSPRTARFVYKRFEIISWIFLIILFVSLFFSAQAGYYYARYGNCNGPDATGFCIFDPFQHNGQTETCSAGITEAKEDPKPLEVYDTDPSFGNKNAKVIVIEAGCFQCSFTKQAVPLVIQLMANYKDQIRIVYKDFPVSSYHENAILSAEAARCADEQGKFWDYYFLLFKNQYIADMADLKGYAFELGLNQKEFNDCLESHKYQELVERDYQEALDAGVYGTPTFYVNDQVIVGVPTFNEISKLIEEELKN